MINGEHQEFVLESLAENNLTRVILASTNVHCWTNNLSMMLRETIRLVNFDKASQIFILLIFFLRCSIKQIKQNINNNIRGSMNLLKFTICV